MLSPLVRDYSVLQHHFPCDAARRVLAQARPFKGWFIILAAAVLEGSTTTVIPMLLFQCVINDGVLTGSTDLVVQLTLVVAGLVLVGMGLGLLEHWCSARIREGLTHWLRCQLFDRVNGMSLTFFAHSSAGRLVSRIVRDITGAQQTFTSASSQALSSTTTLLLVLGSMLLLSWQLTLAAPALLSVSLVPARLATRRTARLTRLRMDHQAQLTEIMTERFTVSGTMLAKLFGNPRRKSRMLEAQAGQLARDGVQMTMMVCIFPSTLTLAGTLAIAVFYGLGGSTVIRGQLSPGILIAMVALLARLYGPLTQLSNLRIDPMTAMVGFERVFEVLDLKPSIYDTHDSINVPGPPNIEFDKVWFTYPTASEVSLPPLTSEAEREQKRGGRVLSEISFYVEPGQTVVLVGPSGAGKTAITHLVTRLYEVKYGAIRVGDVDVRGLKQASLCNTVGYVTQDAHLFHDTICANLQYAMPKAEEQQLWGVLEGAQLADLVCGLPDRSNTMVGERGYRLSGEERQRLAIAWLLLKSPLMVILDKAIAHLDSNSERLVQQALDVARQGRTTIVVARRLSTVRSTGLILVLENSRITEHGTHDELPAADGAYAGLYQHQFDAS